MTTLINLCTSVCKENSSGGRRNCARNQLIVDNFAT